VSFGRLPIKSVLSVLLKACKTGFFLSGLVARWNPGGIPGLSHLYGPIGALPVRLDLYGHPVSGGWL